jgi:hypothetical protein
MCEPIKWRRIVEATEHSKCDGPASVMPREKTKKGGTNDNCNDTDKYTTKENIYIDRMRGLSGTASAAISTLHLACTRDPIMRLANRVAPLQNGKVRRHVRRREERMDGLRMCVQVLRREVHHQWRVRRRGCGHARGEVRERRERGGGRRRRD